MELKDISILNLMPTNLAEDRNIKMIAEAFDEVLREIIKKIPGIAVIPNLVLNQIVNETLIDLLAWQFHVDFYEPDMPFETKRELVLKSLDWHYRKGTPSVIEDIVSTVFSRARIQEWYEYGGQPYSFRIGTDEEIPNESIRKNLFRAINTVKNTRSVLDKITSYITLDDVFNVYEHLTMKIYSSQLSDRFGNPIKYNGIIKYDGHTVNPNIKVVGKYNGIFRYGNNLKYNGFGHITSPYRPIAPFKYSSGIVDTLAIETNEGNTTDNIAMNETSFIGMRKHHFYSGSYKYNGVIKNDGMILIPLG